MHVYPYAEEGSVRIEDTGVGPRRYVITGFLVDADAQLGYPSLASQERDMIAACKAKGPGSLVHSSLGTLLVSAGPRYPSAAASTTDTASKAADGTQTAATSDFASKVGAAVKTGAEAVNTSAITVADWTEKAVALVGDPARAASALAGLAGVRARYGGSGITLAGLSSVTPTSLIAASTTAVSAVKAAAETAQGLAKSQ